MERIDSAILRTVLYADIFDYPMTIEEIHHFLIAPEPVPLVTVRQRIKQSTALKRVLIEQRGYVACAGSEAIIDQRCQRQRYAQSLWPKAVTYGRWLARMPFVRMVAMTGSLAMQNPAHAADDIDYFIVTQQGRVWLARAFAILLVRWGQWHGVMICPNFVLAENRLTQQQQDLYIAHEIVQMIPLYGLGMYQQFLAANTWAAQHMANARTPYHQETEQQAGPLWTLIKDGLETLLNGPIGNRLEDWEHRRKSHRFAPDMQADSPAARVDTSQVKGHFQDHGQRILAAYHQRLHTFNLHIEE